MKKALKIIGLAVAGLVGFVLLAVLTLPLWLGPVVKPSANALVPTVTKTAFNLGHLALNPYTGRFELGDVVIGNPAGYAEPNAMVLSNLVVDVDMATVNEQQLHIEEVTLDGFFISYVFGGEHGTDNIKQIQYNIAGGKEKYEAKQAKAKEQAARQKAEPQPAGKPGRSSTDVAMDVARKLVIDRLTIRGIRVKIAQVVIPVPAIVLTDLGKKSGGVTTAEVFEQCWAAILKSATSLNEGVKALTASVKDMKLGDKAGKAADDLKNQTDKAMQTANEAAKKATEAVDKLKGLFK